MSSPIVEQILEQARRYNQNFVNVNVIGAESLERAEKVLSEFPGGVTKAIRDAEKHAISKLRKYSTIAIQEKYDITPTAIKANENIRITKSYNYNSHTMQIHFSGKKIPLYRFNRTYPREPFRDFSHYVSVKMPDGWRRMHPGIPARAHQLKRTPTYKFQNAFVATMDSGHTGIFERTGGVTEKGRDEIAEVMGSSVPQMLGSREVLEKLTNKAAEEFEKRFEHNVQAILNGWMK